MNAHLPAIQVVLPLLAAPVCVLLQNRKVVGVWATLVAWASFAIAITMLVHTMEHGTISYALGGWESPLGIELRVDVANAFLATIVTGIASMVLPYGPGSATLAIPEDKQYLFYTAFLLCMTGLLGMSVTGDAFNVFVFVEITSLSSYTLIALGKGRRALTAAFSYLVMGTIGGTFILLAIGLCYQMTGTLNMADMALRLQPVMGTRTVLVAFGFFVVGASIKLAVFPLHQWMPNAYTHAPSVVSAFLSATATKVSYFVLVRVVFTIFGAAYVFGTVHFEWLLMPLSIAAMFVGSIAAMYQTHIKRLLAYSSMAQIGYMTLGLSMNSVEGLTGGLVHLFNHGLMKGGLFLVVANITFRLNSSKIEDMAGLARKMPWTSLAFAIGGLSLIGVPGTAGFISKWYLVQGALVKGQVWLALLILMSSLLAVGYVWKVIEVMLLKPPTDRVENTKPAPLSMIWPVWVMIGSTVVFGLWTTWTGTVAEVAAETLMGLR